VQTLERDVPGIIEHSNRDMLLALTKNRSRSIAFEVYDQLVKSSSELLNGPDAIDKKGWTTWIISILLCFISPQIHRTRWLKNVLISTKCSTQLSSI
jgi:hypothetical protein